MRALQILGGILAVAAFVALARLMEVLAATVGPIGLLALLLLPLGAVVLLRVLRLRNERLRLMAQTAPRATVQPSERPSWPRQGRAPEEHVRVIEQDGERGNQVL